MATSTAGSTPRKESTLSRSFRAPKQLWALAEKKAADSGLKINRVMIELLEGWVRGVYILPKTKTETVRVYPTAAVEQPVQETATVG